MVEHTYKCNICEETFLADNKNLFGIKWDSNDFITCPCDL